MKAALYVCAGCGKRAPKWRKSWRWFGSIDDLWGHGLDGIGITCGATADCDAAAERKVIKRRVSPARARSRKTKHDKLVESALAKLSRLERQALGLE